MTRINSYDFMNLIVAFDRSLEILIQFIERENKGAAIQKAKDMRNAISKLRSHVDAKEDHPVTIHKAHGPHGAIV